MTFVLDIHPVRSLMLACAAALAGACSIAKHIPEGEFLLNKEKLTIEGKGLKKEDLRPFITQRPNSTIAWLRFNLWIYNFHNPLKNRWIDRKLRQFGEAPVIYDSIQAALSAMRISEYVTFRGYYGSRVEVQVNKKRQKADLHYRVRLAEPFAIRRISYSILDSLLDTALIIDPQNTLLHSGGTFDGEVLENETNRIAGKMRENGYYLFNKNYITFAADTSVGSRQTDLTAVVHQELADPLSGARRPHRKFVVGDILLNADYDPARMLNDVNYQQEWDTSCSYGLKQIYRGRPGLLPKTAAIYTRIEKGTLYNEKAVNATYDNFSRLRLFQSINIQFAEAPKTPADTAPHTPSRLNATIQMTPLTLMNYRIGGDVSLSGNGLWGAAMRISYQHKNLFRGAEILDVNFNSIFQKIQWQTNANAQNSVELSANASINIPRFDFLFFPIRTLSGIFKFRSPPFNQKLYSKVLMPRMMLSAAVNYQQHPDYVRWLSSASLGYSWQNVRTMTYILSPIDLNLIQIQKSSDNAFFNTLENNPYLLSLYQNTFLLGASLSAIYNTQKGQSKNYSYLRLDAEFKGNLLAAVCRLADAQQTGSPDDRHFQILDTRFAQFARVNLNYTHHRELSGNTALAMRAIFGLGAAYGNSLTMPFDKMYYAGGPYSLRGWQIRGVGPGAYYASSQSYIINRIANMRAEFNVEYRFKLFGMLEGAAFFDAGNIWSTDRDDSREGAQFGFGSLHQSVAMDWGLGLRFVLNVIVVRLDYGIQIHNPVQSRPYFVPPKRWLDPNYSAVIIALGYPF